MRRAIRTRLRSELKTKLALAVALNLWVTGSYQFLQRHHFFPGTVIAGSVIDGLFPFWDQTAWVYLSIYLLMPIGPFLMKGRREILRYAAGILLIDCTANLVFVFWPTVCPRPEAIDASPVYRIMIAMDNPFHAFPSLHAAFAIYSACCAGRALCDMGAGARWRTGVWLWAALILISTLTTRQHMVPDIIAGSLLGAGAYHVVLHRSARRECNSTQFPLSFHEL